MKKKLLTVLMIAALCLLAAVPALAADVFAFSEKAITLFEDETAAPELNREGAFADGEVVFKTDSAKVATVSADGVITPVAKGKTKITASLMQNGKRVRSAAISVTVLRRVTKVTLSRKNLTILDADDPMLEGLLKRRNPEPETTEEPTEEPENTELPPEEPENPEIPEEEEILNPVIVLIAGRSVNLSAVCTPEDASNRKISFTTSDVGIAKIANGTKLRGVEEGECDLTVASVQNPEIQEVFHVLVIEPVKKVQINAPEKSVFAGERMELDAVCLPENASIRDVIWSSRKPAVATVDEDGVVTGLAKGDAVIEAKAADGSGASAAVTIRVMQNVTGVTLKETEATIQVKRTVQLGATVLPKEANNKKLIWTSTDDTVATVSNGVVTGRKAGTCVVTCVSESNPDVMASAIITVIQPVTKITFDSAGGISMPVRTTQQLYWNVEPEDATIKDVTFKSNHPEIAAVDENGLVTGLKRGTATITATAADGSKRTGAIRVNVTQPVEGVTLSRQIYYVQRERGLNIKATVLPKDANNQNVEWSIGDESIATVRRNGTSTGRVTGRWNGYTSVTATTEDGGYTATATVKVADFDGAVKVEGLEITNENKIRITLWNTSDFTVERVYFRVDCYDLANNPMVVNKDGISTGFDGTYPLPLQSGERTMHGQFWFDGYEESGLIGAVVLTVTGYQFDNGQEWEIPEEYQVPTLPVYGPHFGTVTPTPLPPEDEDPEGELHG